MNILFLRRLSKFRFILFSFYCFFINCAFTSKSKIPDISNLTPEDIQKKVYRNFQNLNSFEGKARVIIELPGQGYSGFSNVYINLPDSLFVKTEAILGIDVGALFVDHQYFGAYAPRENIFYYGEIESLDLREFLQIELHTEELYEALTGLNQIKVDQSSRLSFADSKFLIITVLEQGKIKYWIDPKKYVVTKSQIVDEKGQIILTKKFGRFRKNKGVILPQNVWLTRPQAKERITVFYTSQKINRTISPKNFKIKIADNAKRVYWGDIEQPQLDRKLIK